MQFTEEEKKMIAWLRQQHEGWRSVRIIILIASMMCALFAAWDIFKTGFGAHPLVLIVIAAYGASYTLGSWAGRPEVSLLLKLVEAQEPRHDA
ncbi:hypothetical protein AGMMS50225_10550 [Betaproteobacteria bacterium]|nr:hypothetical protein AGMMS50225_10550 [Betaproteobacteria bacterium]